VPIKQRVTIVALTSTDDGEPGDRLIREATFRIEGDLS
jgi:hypothetical protein